MGIVIEWEIAWAELNQGIEGDFNSVIVVACVVPQGSVRDENED